MISAKSKAIIELLQTMQKDDVILTASDIAKMLDIESVRSVDCTITAGLCRKGLAVRVPMQVEIDLDEGGTKWIDIKRIMLTPEGMAIDVDKANAEEQAAEDELRLAKRVHPDF